MPKSAKDLNEKLDILDGMLIKLGKMVFFCRSSLGVYEKIAEHASVLKPYSMGLGLTQKFAQIALALEAYNLFDKDRHHEIVSVPHAISFILKNELPVRHKCNFLEGLSALGVNISQINEDDFLNSSLLKLSLSRPNFNNDEALKLLKNIRNTMIAHQSLASITEKRQAFIPAPAEFDRLLDWCDLFIETTYDGFIGGIIPADTRNHAKRHINSLNRLLQQVIKAQEA